MQQQQVMEAIKNLDIKYLDNQITTFFDKIINVADRLNSANILNNNAPDLANEERIKLLKSWWNNSSQLGKINKIIRFSQDYQAQLAELKSPIKRLEKIAIKFFEEGGKCLSVGADGELKVQLRDGRVASVFELSSGEKQILIMIAHLIFEEDRKPSGVFIIDEPELSLHLAWQEIFVDSIKEASPKTQFILATHAPAIIAKSERKQYSQDLNRFNSTVNHD